MSQWDIFNERAAAATTAGTDAQRAGAEVARTYSIDGLSDPAYIANLIQSEIDRHAGKGGAANFDIYVKKPHAVGSLFPGWSDAYVVGATDITMPAGVGPVHARAARSSAIRLLHSYATSLDVDLDDPDEVGDFVRLIATHLSAPTAHRRTGAVEAALRKIQGHRRGAGLPPLDTAASGWTEEDVILEAERLKGEGLVSNPQRALKRRLML